MECLAVLHGITRLGEKIHSREGIELKNMVNGELALYHACSDIDGIVLNHRVRISFKIAQSQDLNIVYIFSSCGVRISFIPFPPDGNKTNLRELGFVLFYSRNYFGVVVYLDIHLKRLN